MSIHNIPNKKITFSLVLTVSIVFSAGITLSSTDLKGILDNNSVLQPNYHASVGVVIPLIDQSDKGLSNNVMLDILNMSKDELSQSYNITWDVRVYSEINQLSQELLNVSESNHDLIITFGFQAIDALEAAASQYLNNKYVLLDAISEKSNIASVTFKEHEASFLVGSIAAMVSTTKHLGFFGALDLPLFNSYRSGYEQGARYINPEINITSLYSPDIDNPFNDPMGGATVAEAMLKDGADVFYTAAHNTGIGFLDRVIEAREDGENVYAIGADADMDAYAAGTFLTSSIKRFDQAITLQVESLISGNWLAGLHVIGAKENGVGISSMKYTQTEANFLCDNGESRLEFVNTIMLLIANDTIQVDRELQDPTVYNTTPHMCTTTTTTTNTSTTTGAHSTTTEQSPDTASNSNETILPQNFILWILPVVFLSGLHRWITNKRQNKN